VRNLVPEVDRRLGPVVLVPHRAEAGRAQQKVPARPRFEAEPARGKHSEKVPARKEQHVAVHCPHPASHPVGPRPDLVRQLPSRAAVAEQLPVRALGTDVGAGETFVRAVVPFEQVRLDLSRGGEAGQLARPDRPLQGAREHPGERQALEPLSELARLDFALRGQRQVGHARVLVRNGPGGLAVPRQVHDRKRVAHGRAHSGVRPGAS
jgi:hypothetical protein